MIGARSYSLGAIAAIGLVVAGVVRRPVVAPPAFPRPALLASARHIAGDSLDELLVDAGEMTVANDPFRLANAPPAVRFDPNNEGGIGAELAAPAPARPVMILKAIVGGPPWQAVVDGIPGQAVGTVVRAGITFDKLFARAVTRDSVVIQGPDTTWVLSFARRP
jgi:hypothetical protein